MTRHEYELALTWTGNTGPGTRSAASYSRDHEVTASGVGVIQGSADVAFRGDPSRWNPEQLFVASLAQCHMLWYLGLAARAGIVVTAYEDHPQGVMIENASGSGQFASVTLRPIVTVADADDTSAATALHDRVGEVCFIARSVTTPIHHAPVTRTA